MKNFTVKPVLTALLIAASLAAGAAHAEGAYVGGSIGMPDYKDSIRGISGDASGVSGKVYGGYQFTPNVAVEGGYADLGHVDRRDGSIHSHGEFLDAVGIAPLNNDWSLLGRVGVAHVDVNTSNGEDNGLALKVGVGAQYAIDSRTSVRGEWERYHTDVFDGKPDIDQYTVGVRIAF